MRALGFWLNEHHVFGNEQSNRVTDGVSPPPSPRGRIGLRGELKPTWLLKVFEDLLHYAVALVLLFIGFLVLYHATSDLLNTSLVFSARMIEGINGVLLAIIVLELMTTVVAHFEHAGLQLKPFLIIGIISAVRHILTIGARLTLAGEVTGPEFRHSQIELGVETAVVLGLAVSLLLVRLGEKTAADRADDG